MAVKEAFYPYKSQRLRGRVVEGSGILPNGVHLKPWLCENMGRRMGNGWALPLHYGPFLVELQESTTKASTG